MMESGGAALGISWVAKFGFVKILTLGAAALGAGLMAVFRPPKTRKEMFAQSVVALGSSLLFGNTRGERSIGVRSYGSNS